MVIPTRRGVVVLRSHQPGHKTRAYPDREADGARRELSRFLDCMITG